MIGSQPEPVRAQLVRHFHQNHNSGRGLSAILALKVLRPQLTRHSPLWPRYNSPQDVGCRASNYRRRQALALKTAELIYDWNNIPGPDFRLKGPVLLDDES